MAKKEVLTEDDGDQKEEIVIVEEEPQVEAKAETDEGEDEKIVEDDRVAVDSGEDGNEDEEADVQRDHENGAEGPAGARTVTARYPQRNPASARPNPNARGARAMQRGLG